ncbi:MAG: hemerythrin domain-containing protein, partial [Bacteriovoracaceae bacterium]|nr:hemerythrin domain-containing protein [Bacteriovoracaceae bacterium]
GYKEHFEIESMLRGLQFMDRLDANWRPMARKLRELLMTHIKEEENEIFKLCKSVFNPLQAEQMGEMFRTLKPQIEQEGDTQTTLDMMVNLLPPKYSAKVMNSIKNLST